MKIILTRTGGIIPLKKQAETETEWTDDDINSLFEAANIDDSVPGEGRDSTYYRVQAGDKTALIDFEKIPARFRKALESLKDDLQVVK